MWRANAWDQDVYESDPRGARMTESCLGKRRVTKIEEPTTELQGDTEKNSAWQPIFVFTKTLIFICELPAHG